MNGCKFKITDKVMEKSALKRWANGDSVIVPDLKEVTEIIQNQYGFRLRCGCNSSYENESGFIHPEESREYVIKHLAERMIAVATSTFFETKEE